MFYSNSATSLTKEIEYSFLHDMGPGKLPNISQVNHGLIGVIVPHAGLAYSGSIAAYAYNEIAENGFADTFIVLGPNHHGFGSGVAVYPEGTWETPLGRIPVDTDIVSKLSGGIIDRDESTHLGQENSIEVQLPFLQYMAKKQSFRIAPILMGMQDYDTSCEVGNKIASVVQKSTKKIQIIASSDFSHEGMSYGRIPPDDLSAVDYAKKQDKQAITPILSLDNETLIKTIEQNRISMCGYGPIIALMTAAKKLGATQASLLKYATSYDISPNPHACVGYAAFAIHSEQRGKNK